MTKIKDELVAKLAERYQRAERGQKTKILDEFIELAGCHRKHAIRVLSKPATASSERAYRGRRKTSLFAVQPAPPRASGAVHAARSRPPEPRRVRASGGVG